MNQKREGLSFDVKAFLLKSNGERTVSNCAANEIIYRQGDHADSIFYVNTGKVKLSVTSEEGKEAVIAMLKADDFFGEQCLDGEAIRLSTATALSACAIMQITKAGMTRIIHSEPAFAEFFIAHLLVRSGRIQADLVDQLFNSSERRLARALLILANFGKEGQPEPVLAKISQETLAEIVGTTRARINLFMNKFRRLELISYNGTIEVHPSLLNMVLHEKPEINSGNSTV